jgi:hypothetical protein
LMIHLDGSSLDDSLGHGAGVAELAIDQELIETLFFHGRGFINRF